MTILILIIFFCLLGSVISVFLAAVVLILSQKMRSFLLPMLASYAAGTLLGAAFLGMLPTALKMGGLPDQIIVKFVRNSGRNCDYTFNKGFERLMNQSIR